MPDYGVYRELFVAEVGWPERRSAGLKKVERLNQEKCRKRAG
jgi:hypothetical protein